MNDYMKNTSLISLIVICLGLALFTNAHSATITIVNDDGPGEGLNDPTPFGGAPGNNASTLGQARENSFLYAAALLGAELESNVVIQVRARFDSQFCSNNSATLGSAGALSVHRDFTNAPIPGTFYPQALANSYAGTDLNGLPDIGATFNSNLNGDPECLGGAQWYYGTDANPPGGTIDFVSTAIHEIIHGLGFSSQIVFNFPGRANGSFLNGFPAAYDRNLVDDNLTQLDTANNSTRVAAILSGNGLLWEGLSVREIVSQKTSGTRIISGNEYIQMFAPSTYQGGSSTSHYDTVVFPNEIMEPSLVVDEHDLTFSLALLEDIGWILSNNPPSDPEGTNAGECTDSIDNDGDGPIDCDDSSCSADPACNNPGGTGAYIETGGQVVMEAENFDENNPGNADDWFLSTSQGGFSGTGYMESGVNNGNTINTGYAGGNSPELKYLVNFTNTGTYFVWVRSCAPTAADNSIHAGIDGNENSTSNRIKLDRPCGSFTWTRTRMSNASNARLTVSSSGVHEINIWMREDGSRVDKILLTTSSGFTPTGTGPAESTRDGDPPPPPEVFTLNVQTNGGTGTGDVSSNPGGINCGGDCTEDYVEDTVVTLTATPDSGSSFEGWTGNADCSDGQVAMNSAKSCTSIFDILPPEVFTLNVQTNGGTGTGDVSSNPGGINCGGDCSGDYDEDTVVTLTATPDSGSEFINWSGDCAGTNVITNVTITSNKTCTANFNLETPPGGTGAYIETGGQVVMEAENFDENNPGNADDWFLSTSQGGFSGTGYMESGVNNGNTINTGYAGGNSPELKYLVNFTNTGTYFVWVRSCAPTAGDNSIHAGIDGNENSTSNRIKLDRPCGSFTWTRTRMSNASNARLTVSSSGVHEINIWMREDGGRVDKILLTTSSGFTPTGTGPAESTRDGDPPPPPEVFTLNVQTNGGSGTGDVSSNPGGINCGGDCSGDYDEDTVVTLTATPDSGSEFINWSGDCAGTNVITNVTITSNKTCTANFNLETPPGGTGAYIETGGQVVMEAENYDENNPGNADDWFLSTSQGGFSGTGYMESGVNNGNTINTGYAGGNSPELKYLVNFTNTGTYFVWVRSCAPTAADNSIHAGIDGNENSTSNRIKLDRPCGSFTWTRTRMSNASNARLTVSSSGVHEINIWMREDGSRVDKILLTTSSGFTPTGTGPAESTRD